MEDAQVGSVAEACLSRGSDRSRSWTEARSAAPISLVAISTANSAGSASAAHAERVNAAAELLAADVPVAAAARGLAERFGVSTRQARRYAEQAAGSGRVPVPEARVVFTVKLPASLADRVRERARQTGVTISALVTQALTEFLALRRGKRPPG